MNYLKLVDLIRVLTYTCSGLGQRIKTKTQTKGN